MATTLISFVWNNKLGLPSLPPPGTFNGQTILVTGGSSGIGLAAAVQFIDLGAASVIITARNKSRGDAARQSIEAQTKTEGKGRVKVMELDMNTFAGTKSFADRVKAEVKSIDCVLLNAGLLNTEFVPSSEGWVEEIQVNVLSTALLALLLLPWLKIVGKGKAHLGFVTSGLLQDVDINGDFPKENVLAYFNKPENRPKPPPRDPMYPLSKLLEQYIANEIAKLALGPDGKPEVIVNTICPGMTVSNLARQYKTSLAASVAVGAFLRLIAKSTAGGARTYILAALTTPSEHGKFINHYLSEEEYKTRTVKNITGEEGRRMQAGVWAEAIAILGESVPEITKFVASTNA
ncbi:hypothetical protein BP6252_03216 [Coleophoma cylindrospora]|uniref:Uncharacterized protein n=1 Tax=Coleophoma cylindrospora TaxID=1849047 RepID=A0A3D8S7R4_9HELO|nr:hypothetical protein BP6252_03216 [Coleophoma cylindrospora]